MKTVVDFEEFDSQRGYKVGTWVICNGFVGCIREMCAGQLRGMAVVALDRGQTCVSLSTLTPTTRPA
jgi:hypothetical protein